MTFNLLYVNANIFKTKINAKLFTKIFKRTKYLSQFSNYIKISYNVRYKII